MKIEIPNVTAELSAIERATTPQIQAITGYKIASAADADEVAKLTKHAKDSFKRLETQEKSITGPLREAEKAARDLFRRPKALLTEFIDLGNRVLGDYTAEKEAERRSALAVASQAFAQKAPNAPALAQAVVAVDVAPPAGVSVRELWDFEILDPEAVPRSLCSPDPVKIRAHLKQLPTSAQAPNLTGIRAYIKRSVTSR